MDNNEIETPSIETKKSHGKAPIVIILVMITIIGGAALALLIKDELLKNETITPTTTTTKVVASEPNKILDFKNLIGYDSYRKTHKAYVNTNSVGWLLNFDESFYLLNPGHRECEKNGDAFTYRIRNSKIDYFCKVSYYDGEFLGYDIDIKVNDTFTTTLETTGNSCPNEFYTNDKYIVGIYSNCTITQSYIEIWTLDNKSIGEYNLRISELVNENNNDEIELAPIMRNNILYFVTANDDDSNMNSTNPLKKTSCQIKYIDLNEDNASVKDMTDPEKCFILG